MRGHLIVAVLFLMPLATATITDLRINGELVTNQMILYATEGEPFSAEISYIPVPGQRSQKIIFDNQAFESYYYGVSGLPSQINKEINIDSLTGNPGIAIYHKAYQSDDYVEVVSYGLTVVEDTEPPEISIRSLDGSEENIPITIGTPIHITLSDQSVQGAIIQQGEHSQPIDLETCSQTENTYECTYLTRNTESPITVTARDTAGNPISKGVTTRPDTVPPVIEDVFYESSYGAEAPFTALARHKVILTIQESEQLQDIVVSTFEQNQTFECGTREENSYVCNIQPVFGMENREYDNLNVRFIVSDRAGNTAQRDITVSLIPEDNSRDPNFWSVVGYAENMIDPVFYEINDQTLLVDIQHRKQETTGDARIANINLTNCQAWLELPGESGTPQQVDLPRITVQQNPTSRSSRAELSMQRYTNNNALGVLDPDHPINRATNIRLECTVRTQTEINNYLFVQPESDRIELDLPLTRRTLNPKIQQQRQLETAQSKIDSINENQRKAQQAMAGATLFCAGSPTVSAGSTIMAQISSSLRAAAPGVSEPTARGLSLAAGSLQQTVGKLDKALGPLCKAFSCQLIGDYTGPGSGAALNKWAQRAGLGGPGGLELGTTETVQLLNPYKSIVTATMTACAPAMFYHYQVYEGIQCQYQNCMLAASRGEASITQCDYEKERQSCEQLAGSIAYALPWTNIVSSIKDRILGIIQNPLTVGGAVIGAVCANPDGGIVYNLCQIARYPDVMIPLIQTYNDVITTANTFTQLAGRGADFCTLDRPPTPNPPMQFNPAGFRDSTNPSCTAGFITHTIDGTTYVGIGGKYYNATTTSGAEVGTENEQWVSFNTGSRTGLTETGVPEGSDVYDRLQQVEQDCRDEMGFTEFTETQAYRDYKDELDNLKQDDERLKELQLDNPFVKDMSLVLENQNTISENRVIIQGNSVDIDRLNNQRLTKVDALNSFQIELEDIEAVLSVPNIPESEFFLLQDQKTNLDTLIGEIQIELNEINNNIQTLEDSNSQLQDEINQLEVETGSILDGQSIEELEESADNLDSEIKVNRTLNNKKRQEAARQAKFEYQRDNLYSWGGGIYLSNALSSAQAWGQMGMVLHQVGVDVNNNVFGEALEDARDFVEAPFEEYEKQIQSLVCGDSDEPATDTTLFAPSGDSIAFVTADKARQGNAYQYIISFAVKPMSVDTAPSMELTLGNEVIQSYPLNSPIIRTQANSIGYTSMRNHNTVCLQFTHTLQELFNIPEDEGGNERKLCARIQ